MDGSAAGRLAIDVSVAPTDALPGPTCEAIVAMCTRAFDRDFSSLFDFVVDSTHVLACLDGRLVGHACWAMRRLQPEGHRPLCTAYVDAVATDPDYQGRGVGSSVMRRLAAEVRAFELAGLSTTVAPFYERLGWERWRGRTAVRAANGAGGLVPTPDETVLILRTPSTPPLDTTGLLIADPRPGQPW